MVLRLPARRRGQAVEYQISPHRALQLDASFALQEDTHSNQQERD